MCWREYQICMVAWGMAKRMPARKVLELAVFIQLQRAMFRDPKANSLEDDLQRKNRLAADHEAHLPDWNQPDQRAE